MRIIRVRFGGRTCYCVLGPRGIPANLKRCRLPFKEFLSQDLLRNFEKVKLHYNNILVKGQALGQKLLISPHDKFVARIWLMIAGRTELERLGCMLDQYDDEGLDWQKSYRYGKRKLWILENRARRRAD